MSEFVELAKIPKQNEADELKATTAIKQTISYSSATHILLVTKVQFVGITHRRNNTILSCSFVNQIVSAPNISCGDITEADIHHKQPCFLTNMFVFYPIETQSSI